MIKQSRIALGQVGRFRIAIWMDVRQATRIWESMYFRSAFGDISSPSRRRKASFGQSTRTLRKYPRHPRGDCCQ